MPANTPSLADLARCIAAAEKLGVDATGEGSKG